MEETLLHGMAFTKVLTNKVIKDDTDHLHTSSACTKIKFKGGGGVASSPGPSQILSRSSGFFSTAARFNLGGAWVRG